MGEGSLFLLSSHSTSVSDRVLYSSCPSSASGWVLSLHFVYPSSHGKRGRTTSGRVSTTPPVRAERFFDRAIVIIIRKPVKSSSPKHVKYYDKFTGVSNKLAVDTFLFTYEFNTHIKIDQISE